ncbi:MAG: hypothetical protein SOV22_03055 [Blautia obeum]|nr:hypothetical protein [Blautia obeum]
MEVAVKSYIEERIPALKNRLYPSFTTDLSKLSIAYRFSPISGGHIRQSQLELKIIDKDYDSCKEMEKQLIDLMDMEEDESFVITGGIKFHSEISGGGTLFNDGCQMWEDTLYFILKWRKVNVI